MCICGILSIDGIIHRKGRIMHGMKADGNHGKEGDVCRRQICTKYIIYLRGIVFFETSTLYNRYTPIKMGGGM